MTRRFAVLGERNVRLPGAGRAASLPGTSMSAAAVAFAVLDGGGTAADPGYVMAARILPQVLLVPGGPGQPRRVAAAADPRDHLA